MRKVIAMVLDKPYAVIDVEDGKSLNQVRIELLEQGYPGSVYCISTYEYELIFEKKFDKERIKEAIKFANTIDQKGERK